MADRVPLILNNTSSTIQELPSGDGMDLTGSNIVLSNVANLRIPGGTVGQAIVTDGAGNLSFGNTLSNPGGSNTQIQFNDANAFGASANFTFNKSTNTLTVNNASFGSNVTVANINAQGSQINITSNINANGANVSLGAVGNVKITGGSNGQLLSTDGAGNLSFSTVSGASYMLQPVRAATLQNITLSGSQTIDDVLVVAGDRVLVRRQNTGTENGIYIVSSGAWTRASDFNTGAATLIGGVTVTPSVGTMLAGVTFVCTNTTAITIGTTSITWNRSQNTGFISIWTGSSFVFERAATGSANSGATSIGVGANAAPDSISLGFQASTTGSQSIGIGYNSVVGGQNSVGVGININTGTFANATAIGGNAGANTNGVAVGRNAGGGSNFGTTRQLANAVAIGGNAGYTGQGANSIAIGFNAGYTNQANNSIILNATGANLNQTTANTFTVSPVRPVTDITGLKQLYYNPSTGEIVYYNV